MIVEIPYGHQKIEYDAPEGRIIRSRIAELPRIDGQAEVLRAMAEPIGSQRLSRLAKGKKNAVLIISDHTRPVPSKLIVPPMLAEMRSENPDIEITLLVATGCHREMTKEELVAKLGEEIVANEKIVVHDCDSNNIDLGVLPSGARLLIDRLAVETELLVAEGFIEPHFFAGYSGGRKSILPGLCSRVTVLGNHCGAFIADPHARTGILEGNPIHRDMVAAAEMAKLAYIVNVVINEDKEVAAAFAGDCFKAHEAGVEFLRQYAEVPAIPGDIVITSNGGAPLDQNIYQTVKGMTAAEATVRPGGVIILCANTVDGTGGDFFYRCMRDCTTPAELFEQYNNTPQDETIPDQWQTQILCRVLKEHRVIMVAPSEVADTLREMKLEYAPDLESALAMAGEGEITVIPDGVSVAIRA